MRRTVLVLTAGLAVLASAAPALSSSTTVSTPESAPVGVTVTVHHPFVVMPEDPANGGTITVDGGEGVWVEPRGVPDPTQAEEPAEDDDKDKKEKKDKEKEPRNR